MEVKGKRKSQIKRRQNIIAIILLAILFIAIFIGIYEL